MGMDLTFSSYFFQVFSSEQYLQLQKDQMYLFKVAYFVISYLSIHLKIIKT